MLNKYPNITRIIYFSLLVTLVSSIMMPLSAFVSKLYNQYSFLITENITQYKIYFPNFYFLLFGISRLIKLGFPLSIILLIIFYIHKLHSQKIKVFVLEIPIKHFLNNLIIYLAFAFLFNIIAYFLLPYFLPNSFNQLWLTRYFLSASLILLFVILISNHDIFYNSFLNFLFRPTLPFSLAGFRILLFGYMIFLYSVIFNVGFSSSIGIVAKQPLPFIGFLIEIIPVSPEIYNFFCFSGSIVAFFIMIGYRTRLFLLINTIIVFYVVATPNFFGKLWHMQLVIWLNWIMAFSDCYDVWSIDSKVKNITVTRKAAYGFPIRIIFIHFAMIYFFAGFYKLWFSGWDWSLTDSALNQVYLEWFENYNHIPSLRLDKIPILFNIGAVLVIFFEILFPILLIQKRLRWIAVIGGLFMHNLLGYLIYISFFYWIQVFYIVFIPWNSIIKSVKNNIDFNKINSKRIMGFKLYIPLILFILNFLAGVFYINSYPFSTYPSYSSIVPNTTKNFMYVLNDYNLKDLNIKEEAKKTIFRWENFSRIETPLIDKYDNSSILDSQAVINQWKRWKEGVPVLQSVDSVDVYFVHLYLNPEKMKDTIAVKKVMEIYK